MTFSELTQIRDGKSVKFLMSDVDVSIVNAMRRILLAEIPVLAFDYEEIANTGVHIIKNTTVLNNEFLGARVALVPIYFDENEVHAATDTSSRYKFVLDTKGNGKESSTVPRIITTHDFVILDKGAISPVSLKHRLFPVDAVSGDAICLTRLKDPTEHLHLEAVCSLGIARKHARFQAVSLAVYENELDEEQVAKARKLATDSNRFEMVDKYRLFKPNAFRFSVITECGMRAVFLVYKALDVLLGKVRKLQAKLGEDDTTMFDDQGLLVPGEDDTIGNVVQSFAYDEFQIKRKIISWIGYRKPHPLEDVLRIRLKLTEGTGTTEERRVVLLQVCEELRKYIFRLREEFVQLTSLHKMGLNDVDQRLP
jgi:DNA-directed RNA polymerase subunit L